MSLHASDQSAEAQATTIVVNGRAIPTDQRELSFAQLVTIAFPSGSGANTIYTITYRRGHGQKPEGTLVDGQSVKVKDGMIFNVTPTDKS
jgi:hypothetical protein